MHSEKQQGNAGNTDQCVLTPYPLRTRLNRLLMPVTGIRPRSRVIVEGGFRSVEWALECESARKRTYPCASTTSHPHPRQWSFHRCCSSEQAHITQSRKRTLRVTRPLEKWIRRDMNPRPVLLPTLWMPIGRRHTEFGAKEQAVDVSRANSASRYATLKE